MENNNINPEQSQIPLTEGGGVAANALMDLDKLKEQGAISDDEYNKLRGELSKNPIPERKNYKTLFDNNYILLFVTIILWRIYSIPVLLTVYLVIVVYHLVKFKPVTAKGFAESTALGYKFAIIMFFVMLIVLAIMGQVFPRI